MFCNSETLSNIKDRFNIGQTIFYGCISPEYDWFTHEFKIKKIIKPEQFEIIYVNTQYAPIDIDDRNLLSRLSFNIIRKYHIELTLKSDYNEDKTIVDVYENKDNETIMIFESHVVVSDDETDAIDLFYKLVVEIKSEIDFDSVTTKVIKDKKFKLFRDYYNQAVEIYPEEVIKQHDCI